ncbi:sensor histidine kinase [Streptomyces sp. NPDC057301]|uniref:sensor histidine kinase n=1 Tax=Streptomyces sp. NPDC057301 TaxID=3346093 RepID=UPI003628925F
MSRTVPRGSLRFRLTAVFGIMFFLAGAAIFGGALVLVGNSMEYTLGLPFPAAKENSCTSAMSRLPWSGKSEVLADAMPCVAIDEASREIILASMQTNLMVKGGLTVLAVGAGATTLGWLATGRVLRPLNRITSTAERIAGRTLQQRIDLDAPPGEVKRLADSFDSMLERLDQAFAGQDRFIANAAHELKTPLAVGRTLVEVAVARPTASADVKQLGENLLAVNERHERLIDALLTLARAKSAPSDLLPVDLAEVAGSVLDTMDERCRRRDLRVRADLDAAPVTGDPLLLEQMIGNLVDNAVKYNLDAGVLDVRTGTAPTGAFVSVGNDGDPIAPHEIPVLFEPFRRLTDRVGSMRGSGLGLSIVRAVAHTHQGDAAAAPRTGGGLTVTVTLPRAR